MRLRFAAFAAVCLMLAGCAYSPGLVDRSMAFNRAVAVSTNELLLLNALRARDRLPTYYTRIEADNANTAVQPSVSMSIPFGPGAAARGYTPNFSFGGSSQNQISMQNLDDQKFMRGILSPLPVNVLSFYLQQGWPRELVLTMMISKITVPQAELTSLERTFSDLCSAAKSTEYCNDTLSPDLVPADGSQYLIHVLNDSASCPASHDGDDAAIRTFENYPGVPQEIGCFQAMLRLLIALGPTPHNTAQYKVVATNVQLEKFKTVSSWIGIDKSDYKVGKPDPQGRVTLCKRTMVPGLTLLHYAMQGGGDPPHGHHGGKGSLRSSSGRSSGRRPRGGSHSFSGHPAGGGSPSASPAEVNFVPLNSGEFTISANTSNKEACGVEQAGPAYSGLTLTTRSLEGMIYYLGEVLRAEQATPDPQADGIKVWALNRVTKQETPWTLFVVDQGSAPSSSPVSVHFMGNTYYVPSECANTQDCNNPNPHRSLQVLALLNQIWGLQKQAAQMPQVPTVTVVNP